MCEAKLEAVRLKAWHIKVKSHISRLNTEKWLQQRSIDCGGLLPATRTLTPPSRPRVTGSRTRPCLDIPASLEPVCSYGTPSHITAGAIPSIIEGHASDRRSGAREPGTLLLVLLLRAGARADGWRGRGRAPGCLVRGLVPMIVSTRRDQGS